jgi:sulfide:quinone oxidoreductase
MTTPAQPSTAPTTPKTDFRHEIVVIGGGNGGISVAARLCRALRSPDVAIIEPSDKHYYQPLWTLVGGGVFPKKRSEHSEASVIPPAAEWLRDAVAEVQPEQNLLVLASGKTVAYEFLVVAPGIQIDWDKIKGLTESIGKDGVCSNYSYDWVDKTWEFIRSFKGGNAVFTQPSTPIKCGGAPQKIAYLADDHFRRAGVRDKSNVIFATGTPSIFAVKKYADSLTKVVIRKGIDARFRHELTEIRGASKEAVFENLDTGESVVLPYDMIHVTPPMSAPDFIKKSALANSDGWVDVDKGTLQHVRFPNVFGLGDSSSLPTSKTGAAIRKQAPVLVENLLALKRQTKLTGHYDGYTACPLVTGYGRLIMAEFDYDGTPRETFPFDQSKERRSMYLLKAYGLPALYWHGIMTGRV